MYLLYHYIYFFYILYIYLINNFIYSGNSGQNKAFPKKLFKIVLHLLEVPRPKPN